MSSMRDMIVGITFRDEASRVIRNVERAMDNVERSVQGLGLRLDDASDEFRAMGRTGLNAIDNVEDGLNDAEREARSFNRTVENSSDALNGLKRMAAGIGGVIAGAFAVDKMKDFATSGIELAASTKALNSQFEQVFGLTELTAQAKLNNIANQAGILPDRLKGSFVQMAAFAKTTGADTASALALSERATLAAADSAAFYDRSIEDVTDNLQSFLKGNFENDAALGISATETTRNAKANELYGKSFKKLSEAQKQLTLMAMVEDGNKAAGALGQAAREADGYENVIGNLKGAWDGLKGTMMTPFLDTVTGGMQDLTKKMQAVDAKKLGSDMKAGFDTAMEVIVPTFNAAKEGMGWIIDNKDPLIAGLAGVTAGFVAFKVISTVNGLMTAYQGSAFASTVATKGFNAALRANPIGMFVTGLSLLVAGGVLLYQNWDTVTAKTKDLWGAIGGLEGAMRIIFGPIGILIGAAIDLANNWDNTKTVWGNVWSAIQRSAADSINSVIGLINEMIGVINKIPGVNVPVVAKVDWGQVQGPTSPPQGAAGISNTKTDGSHATGLENVPFDGYRAELHKGEAVLTAQQAGGLRQAGILSGNSNGTPKVNFDGPKPPSPQPQSGGSSEENRPSGHIFQITIHAVSDKAQDIKNAVREAVSDLLDEDLQTM